MAFGGTVKLTGESEYRKAIKNITSDLKGMSKSLKEQATAFSTSDKSLDKSTKNQEELNKALKEQEKQLANAKRSYAQYGVEIQTQTTRHNALSKEYKAAVLELDKIKKASGESSEEYKKQSQIVDELGKELAESSEKLDENKRAQSDLKKVINDSEKTIQQTKDAIEDYNKQLDNSGKEQKEALTPMQSLNKAIDEQEKELSGLKEEYKNAVSMYGKNSSEAKDLAGQIDKLSSELVDNKNKMSDLDSAADKLDNSLKDVDKSVEKSKEGFTVMKGVLANLATQAINKAIDGMKNLASAAMDAYKEYDEGADIIIAKTGATGKAGEELANSYKKVAKSVNGDFTDIGTAVGEVNTRFGLTGKELEDLTTKFLKFSELNGTDVNNSIDSVQKTLEAFGLKGKDASSVLDTFNKVGQDTGISMDTLSSDLMKNASTFSQLGMDIHQAAGFLGQIEKSGVDSSVAITSLSKASQYAAKNGKPLTEVLKDTQKKMSGAKSESEGLQIAYDIFGKKAGAAIYQACKTGTLSFNDLSKAMENNAGSIDKTYEATQDGFDKIKLTMQGFRADMGETVGKLLDENKDKINEALKSGLELVKQTTTYVINNIDTIIPMLKTLGGVIVTVFTVNKVSQFVESVKNISGVVSGVITSFKGAETAVEGANAASKLLNATWLASPVTWLVAGVAALTAGLVVLKKRQDEAIEKEYGLSDAQKESINSSKALANSYREINKAREESTSNINAEYGYIQELKDEYNTLIDSNGKVKKGYEDRANFIINELSKSLGIEQSEIKKLIDENGKLGDSIDKIIQKKKAEAILLASEQAYTEAIQNRQKALEKYQDSLETLDEVEKKYKDTKTKANEVMENYNKLLRINPDDAAMYLASNKKIIDANAKAEESYNKAKKGVSDAEEAYVGYNSTIKNYEGLSSAIISGDTKKIENALMNMENNFITAENGTKDSLERQVKNLQENYNSMEKAIKNNTPGVTKEMVEQAKTMVDNATKELDKFQGKASESTAKAGVLSADALKNKAKDFENAGNLVGNSMVLGMKKHEAPAGKTGKTSGENFVKNVDSNKGKAKNAGDTLGKNAVSGAKNGASSMTSTGKTAGGNFASGVGSQSGNAKGKGNSIGSNAVSGARSGSSKMNSEGKTAGGNFASGVGSQGTKARNEGKGIANDAKSGASSVSARQTGEDFGEGFGRGISNKSNSVWNYAWNLGINALNAIRRATATASPSKKAMEIGGFFSEGYAIGIDKKTKEVVKASSSLAKSALTSLNGLTQEATRIGLDSGQGFTDALSQSLSINDVQSQLKGLNINSGVSSVENVESSSDASFRQVVSAFKEALSQIEIELDDDKVGSFVDKTVTRLIYT